MAIEFPYREETSKIIGKIYRPVAKVGLQRADGKWIYEYMYIDSGADFTLIPRRLGEFLGFKLEGAVHEVSGIGESKVPVILKNVNVKIGEHIFNSLIGWALIEEVPLILGRAGIFDFFKIRFEQRKRRVVLEPE